MILTVEVQGTKFRIPVGEGEQSLRWLGLVAAQRYSASLMPKGRARAREQSKGKNGSYLPCDIVSGEHGSLGDPNTKINAILSDQDEIEVKLMTEVQVDEVGAPVISPWFEAAFCIGEASQRRIAGAAQRQQRKAKAEREAALKATAEGGEFQIGFSTSVQVLSPTLAQAWEVEAAVNAEWEKRLGAAVEELEPDFEYVQEIKAALAEALPALHAQFVHYSGLFETGPLSGATEEDVGHYLHGAKLLDYRQQHSVVHRACARVAAAGGGGGGSAAAPLDRAAFLEALLRCLFELKDAPGPSPAHVRAGLGALAAAAEARRGQDAVAAALSAPDMLHFCEQLRPALVDALGAFAEDRTAGAGAAARPLLGAEGLGALLGAAFPGLRDPEGAAREAWADAQPSAGGARELPRLVYAEAVEACVRGGLAPGGVGGGGGEEEEGGEGLKRRAQDALDAVLTVLATGRGK